jgi:hypothetical protein
MTRPVYGAPYGPPPAHTYFRASMYFNPSDKSSVAMFYRSHAALAERDKAFLEMLNHPTNPLTSKDIATLYFRNPARYGRYVGFVNPADIVGFASA